MIHHHITKYIENEKMYVEAWIQIDIFGQCICFSKRRIEVSRSGITARFIRRRGERMNNEWITIDFKNGEVCHYKPDEYTDYYYDKKYFIVIRDKQWIGLYNLDEIRYVEIGTVEEAEGEVD